MPFDLNELDRGKPIEAARQPSDLPVMSERRIDKGGGANEGPGRHKSPFGLSLSKACRSFLS
jgi:hypothetical protein